MLCDGNVAEISNHLIFGNDQRRFDKQAAKHHGFERLIPGVASMTL
jgi:hypothetical protein